MKLRQPKVEKRIRAREVLGVSQEQVKPFDLEQEFEKFHAELNHDFDQWKTWSRPPEGFWVSVGQSKVFFPDWRDVNQDLDYAKINKDSIRSSIQGGQRALMVFYLMQLFPDQRQNLLELSGLNSVDIPRKTYMGELLLMNELLILSTAQPERLHEYAARANQELATIKGWINESFGFQNQFTPILELAANFLLLCPEHKAEIQQFLAPHVQEILKALKVGEAWERFKSVCNLEVIYGKNDFLIDQTGDLIRQPAKPTFAATKSLPDRFIA